MGVYPFLLIKRKLQGPFKIARAYHIHEECLNKTVKGIILNNCLKDHVLIPIPSEHCLGEVLERLEEKPSWALVGMLSLALFGLNCFGLAMKVRSFSVVHSTTIVLCTRVWDTRNIS